MMVDVYISCGLECFIAFLAMISVFGCKKKKKQVLRFTDRMNDRSITDVTLVHGRVKM